MLDLHKGQEARDFHGHWRLLCRSGGVLREYPGRTPQA